MSPRDAALILYAFGCGIWLGAVVALYLGRYRIGGDLSLLAGTVAGSALAALALLT